MELFEVEIKLRENMTQVMWVSLSRMIDQVCISHSIELNTQKKLEIRRQVSHYRMILRAVIFLCALIHEFLHFKCLKNRFICFPIVKNCVVVLVLAIRLKECEGVQ